MSEGKAMEPKSIYEKHGAALTVGALRSLLSDLPDETPVIIEDADTGWFMKVTAWENQEAGLIIASGY